MRLSRPRIRIIVADDHPIVRKGLCQIVAADSGLQIVAEAATADETLAAAQAMSCDVIVLDLGMPGVVGLSLLKTLRARIPSVPVLILSIAPEDQFGVRAVRAGAAGYMPKRCAPAQLVDAIRHVAAGGLYVSTATGQALARDVLRWAPRSGQRTLPLSDRELEVLQLLASGLAGTAIAERLGVSSKSVATYRKRLLTKLGLDSNAALIRYAIEHRLLDA